jgi:hypothetical protein
LEFRLTPSNVSARESPRADARSRESAGGGGGSSVREFSSAAINFRSASRDAVASAPRASQDSVGARRERGAGGSVGGPSTEDVLRQHRASQEVHGVLRCRSCDSEGSRGGVGSFGGGTGGRSGQPTLLQSAYVRSRLSLSASSRAHLLATPTPTVGATRHPNRSAANPLLSGRAASRESVSAPGPSSRLSHGRHTSVLGSRHDDDDDGHPDSLFPGARGSRDSVGQLGAQRKPSLGHAATSGLGGGQGSSGVPVVGPKSTQQALSCTNRNHGIQKII